VRLKVIYIVTESGARFTFGFLIDVEPEEADVELIPALQSCGCAEPEELPA
jgi:hypothetical protein